MGWSRVVVEDATLIVDMGSIDVDISNCVSGGRYSRHIVDSHSKVRFTVSNLIVESLTCNSKSLGVEVRLEESLLLFASLDQLLGRVEQE